jgi:hypothetical protein
MSLTLRLSAWIRLDVKHSDCEIDLKYPDYSTRRRTELADEPACCGRAKTGQDGKPDFRYPTNRRQRRRSKLATAIRETRFEPDWRFETFSNGSERAIRTGRAT